MSDFVGRRGYIASLEAELNRVRQTGCGRFASMRGCRRVGKSRLVDEFLKRGAGSPLPHVVFTARDSRWCVSSICSRKAARARSCRPRRWCAAGQSWDGVLTFLAATAGGTPQGIVIDEFPYLLEQDPSL